MQKSKQCGTYSAYMEAGAGPYTYYKGIEHHSDKIHKMVSYLQNSLAPETQLPITDLIFKNVHKSNGALPVFETP